MNDERQVNLTWLYVDIQHVVCVFILCLDVSELSVLEAYLVYFACDQGVLVPSSGLFSSIHYRTIINTPFLY